MYVLCTCSTGNMYVIKDELCMLNYVCIIIIIIHELCTAGICMIH